MTDHRLTGMRHLLVWLGLIALCGSLCAPADARHRRARVAFDDHARLGYASVGDKGGPEGWSTYTERDVGASIDYPANVFSIKDGPPDKGAGQRFRTADGTAQLAVYELGNNEGDTPQTYLRRHLLVEPASLDYARVSDRFFAISGLRQERTFYSRCNFSLQRNGPMYCVYLEYPARETRAWDNIVTRISRSLNANGSDLATQ